jgi:Ribosomal protein S3, C-terminal domain
VRNKNGNFFMGHLVNPIAFRLGWSRQWVDDYFVELRYYPEVLHRLLRFRYFLNSFFTTKGPQPLFNSYLISHFNFFFDLRGFTLQIFYYNSRMDPAWYDFFEKIVQRPFGLRFFPKERHEPPAFSSWNRKCLSLLFIFYHYGVNGVLDQPYTYRLPFFKAYQNTLQAQDFCHAYPRYVFKRFRVRRPYFSVSEQECFVLLHLLRFRTLQEPGRINFTFRGRGLRMVNFEAVAQTFFRLLYINHMTKPYMRNYFYWLRFLGQFFFLKNAFTIHFFQVNNEQISARFLAKFLAIRFSQGFTVRGALNPIRRDLRLAKRLAKRAHYKKMAWHRRLSVPAGRGGFSALTDLLTLSQAFTPQHRFNRKCAWGYDHLFLSFRLRRHLPKKFQTINLRSLFASTKKKNRRRFFNKKAIKSYRAGSSRFRSFYRFLRFFHDRRFLYSFVYHFTSQAKKLFFFKNYALAFFLEYVFDRFANYEMAHSFLSRQPFAAFRGLSSAGLYHLTGASLLSFLSFSSQASISPRSYDTLFAVKRQLIRRSKKPAIGIQGFRVRLHGRFTRKQIAASYHFQEGAMPLSAVDVSIDYGFATVPLRNSAIGIKVWLYRRGLPPLADFSYTFL